MGDLELADLLKPDFVDDDLASCFLWAAGEKAMDKAAGGGGGLEDPYGLLKQLDSAAGAGDMDLLGLGDLGGSDSTPGGGRKDQKVQLRMARKAQAARDARRRHKGYVQGLEGDVAKLQADIAAAKARTAARQAAAGGAAKLPSLTAASAAPSAPAPASSDEKSAQLNQMELLLRRRSVEQLQPEANLLIERYVGSKRSREQTMLGYLDIIEEILEPSALVAVAFGQVTADSKAAKDAAAVPAGVKVEAEAQTLGAHGRRASVGSAMLGMISTELNLTPTQLEALMQHRTRVQSVRTRPRVAPCGRAASAASRPPPRARPRSRLATRADPRDAWSCRTARSWSRAPSSSSSCAPRSRSM
jgi:hypothetical protein